MTAPADDLFTACCNSDVAAVNQLLANNTFTDAELDRMVPTAMNQPDMLRVFLAKVKPSPESMFQLVHLDPITNFDSYTQVLALKPTPEEVGGLVDQCQTVFFTRMNSFDEKGNEVTQIMAIPDDTKNVVAKVVELGLDAGAKPQNTVTLVGGMAAIGRPDLADRLAMDLPDLEQVAFFAFRDRETLAQAYVTERTQLAGKVGGGALAGALADANESLARELLAKGVSGTAKYNGASMCELLGLGASPAIAKALIDAGAEVTPQSLFAAVGTRNAPVLQELVNGGGLDPEANALLSSATASQPQLISILIESQKYTEPQLAGALNVAREGQKKETIAALENALESQSLDVPEVPKPWKTPLDLASATLPEMWAEWLRYRAERIYPEDTAQPAAADSDFAEMESAIGARLPDDVQWLYRQTNGENARVPYGRGMIFGARFLSLAEATQSVIAWQGVRESIADTPNEQGGPCLPPDTVKREYINKHWISLTDVNGNHISVDLDPGPKGVVGQIISSGRDESDKVQFGVSFTEFLRSVLRQIVADNVEVLQDSGFVLGRDRTVLSGAVRALIGNGW